jgi:hypothetical protein
MNWLDIKLLATIGASAAVGVAATAALLTRSVEVGPFDQTVLRGSVAVIHIPSETPNLQHADHLRWWDGEAPIRFSGPGAMGLGKTERNRRRSGFRLKNPPRRLGLEMNLAGTRIRGSEIGTPDTWAEYKLQIRPPTKR